MLTVATVTLLAGVLASTAFAAGKATIIRDEYGVPHVYGGGLKATWFGVGYASAQDRLWQAEVLRRLGTGTSAEFFGPGAVEGDVLARLAFGPPERRAALFRSAPARSKKIMRAFVAGFNAWIEEATATGQLPVEYPGLGLPPPRPWTIDDSMAISMALLQNFGEAGADEIDFVEDLRELIARLGPTEGGAVFFDSHWLSDPTAVTSVPVTGTQGGVGEAEPPPAIPEAVLDLDLTRVANQYRRLLRGWRRNADRAGLGRGPASNAIAIAPRLSADGRPLLLHGPQMGYTVPQINHEMGIHGGGFNVTGMMIAGIPGIPIGVTDRHAWTWTTGGTDNNDLYVETLNPDNPTQYVFRGQLLNLDCRVESINVAGGGVVNQTLCETVHGPVLAQIPPVALSLKTAVRGFEGEMLGAVHGMMSAGSFKAFRKAISRAAYCFNVLYADAGGNIAYWHAGKIPIRAPGDSPWFPHIGTGIAEWQGFIPFRQMPHVKNPAQGWLTSWNNKPRVDWRNSTRGFYQWGPISRVSTLTNALSTIPPGAATVGLIEQLNIIGGWTTDTPSGNGSTVVVSSILGDMLGAVNASADPRLPAIVRLLRSWDQLQLDLNLDGRYDSPAVAVFNTWWPTFIERVFADELGGTLEKNVVGHMAGRLLRPGQGLPLLHDYLDGETTRQAVTGALIDALDSLTAQYESSDPGDWLQRAAVIDWDPIGAADVPDTPWMNRGTYNQISRVASGSRMFAQNVIAPGQSGNPLNPHFFDQLRNYATWTYKPMRLTMESLDGNTESTTEVTVKKRKARRPGRGKRGGT